MAMIQKILVATDFSDCSEDALEMAVELAGREGATLTVLAVCELPSNAYAFAGDMVAPAPELIAGMLADGKRSLAELAHRLHARGITVETQFVEGDAREAILQLAAQRGSDLIVLGSHGRRGLSRLFLGSVAEHVVRAATAAVLVVHPRCKTTNVNGAPDEQR